jgi:hypothetical protein
VTSVAFLLQAEGAEVWFRDVRVKLASSCVLGLDRIVLAEPVFNLFPLRGRHDTLPFHHTRTFTVLSHYVQTRIEDFDDAVAF